MTETKQRQIQDHLLTVETISISCEYIDNPSPPVPDRKRLVQRTKPVEELNEIDETEDMAYIRLTQRLSHAHMKFFDNNCSTKPERISRAWKSLTPDEDNHIEEHGRLWHRYKAGSKWTFFDQEKKESKLNL